MLRRLLQLGLVLLPWPLRRRLLERCYGYELHPTARIGLSWIYPRFLRMAQDARIGHLTVAIHLDRIEMEEGASIDRGNWITGFPKGGRSHFAHCGDRNPELLMGAQSAITKHHHFDCTARIEVGAFTTIAGYQSQFMTHSIDLGTCRQDAAPIRIGQYCFVGTNVVVLGGAQLPDFCVLGAKALLNKAFEETHWLYGGVPARRLKRLPEETGYFRRTEGFIV